jgi:hypothetical protein
MTFKVNRQYTGINFFIIASFLLQGTKNLGALVLLSLFVMLLLSIKKRVKLPLYFALSMLLYIPFLLIGVFNNHPNFHLDFKFHIFTFLFFILLLRNTQFDYLGLFFKINIIIFVSYVLLYVGFLPNLWSESTFGYEGRVYGPSISVILMILFIYIVEERKIDNRLIVHLMLALIYILLTSNFMNLLLAVGLFMLLALNVKNIFKLAISSLLFFGFLIVFKNYLPGGVFQKMEYINRPWEYGSVAIRITDLLQVIGNTEFTWFNVMFGEGVGVTSTVYRVNDIAPSLSRFLTFTEIDNGFYYIFHRGGFVLLFLFAFFHGFLLMIIPTMKGRLAFIMIVLLTNLFSIHYYTYWFNVFYVFFIINKWGYKRRIFRYNIKLIS